jgi:small subunit ribosomal protein S14
VEAQLPPTFHAQGPLSSMHFRLPGLSQIIGQVSKVYRDKQRRFLVEEHEVDRTLFKAIVCDRSLPLDLRLNVQMMFETDLPKDSAAVRVRNRCALTGRPRGVLTRFRLSRNMFRKLAHFGMINGISKARW